MRLTSIFNVWIDALELLPSCIDNHLSFSDDCIVIWSSKSNHGKSDNGQMLEFIATYKRYVNFHQVEPDKRFTPLVNETRKRNYGIEIAKKIGYTHFILADSDEYYKPDEMNQEKKRFDNPSLNGLVHPLKVYIKSPTLYTFDHTLCCGIHKLNKDTYAGNFQVYPYAYDEKGAHIDPSRRISFTKGIERSGVYMHHFSYVRKNIDLKIDNSTANLKRSRQVIYDELRDAKAGYVSKLYHQPLQECENYFDIAL